jgi:2-polyprenyl-6-methoxyphenol hydroxylase-like FAD-dependent oxidoreductase
MNAAQGQIPEPMPEGQMRIAIAGCGIAGLAAALFLHRARHEVCIFEQAPTPAPAGSGLLLQPPGMLVLQHLGVLNAALAAGQPVRRLYGETRTGRTVMDIRYDDWIPGCYGLGIHRGVLWGLLYRAALNKGIAIRPGVQLESVENSADGARVIGTNGSRHGPFDLVVGADGARSALRKAQFKDATREYAWGALWTTLKQPDGWDAECLSQRYDTARIMMGVLPVGRDLKGQGADVTMFWSVPVAKLEAARLDVDAWRKAASAVWPEARPLVDQVVSSDQLIPARYMDVRPSGWVADRLVLIGDAAHGTSPQLGQGATLGLLDAFTLAAQLSSPGELTHKLHAHASARRSHVRYYQWASRMLTPFFQSDSAALAWSRDLFFGLVGRLPVSRAEFLATLVGAKSGVLWGRLDSALRAPAEAPPPSEMWGTKP